MKEPTGSPAKRGYACVRKRTRTVSRARPSRRAGRPVAQHEASRVRFAARRERHAAVVADVDGAQRAARATPGDELTERRDVRAARRRARARGARTRRARRESRARARGSDARCRPTVHRRRWQTSASARASSIHDVGRLDVLILAERAIHPGEGRFVHADRRLVLGVPQRDDVGDAEPESVAVGEAVGGIVAEAGVAHAARRRVGTHAEVVLAHADGVDVGEVAQHLALRREQRVILGGAEASVEADLVARVAHGAHDPARALSFGAIGQVARAHGGERRPSAEHEPRRAHVDGAPRCRGSSRTATQTTGRAAEAAAATVTRAARASSPFRASSARRSAVNAGHQSTTSRSCVRAAAQRRPDGHGSMRRTGREPAAARTACDSAIAARGDDRLALDRFAHDARRGGGNALVAVGGAGALLLFRAGDVDDETQQRALDGDDAVRGRDAPAARAQRRRGVVRRRALHDAQTHDVAGAVVPQHRGEVDQHVEGEALGGGERCVWMDGEHVSGRRERRGARRRARSL